MNAVFADTSALLALLGAMDQNHAGAERAFATLRGRHASLVSTSFVLDETYALVGRRLDSTPCGAFARISHHSSTWFGWTKRSTTRASIYVGPLTGRPVPRRGSARLCVPANGGTPRD